MEIPRKIAVNKKTNKIEETAKIRFISESLFNIKRLPQGSIQGKRI